MSTTSEQSEIEPPPATAKRKRKPPSEWKKTDKLKAIRDKERDFLSKAELAHHLECHVNTINRWVREGTIPPAWSKPGSKHPMWLRRHYEAFKKNREWPAEAFWNRRARAAT